MKGVAVVALLCWAAHADDCSGKSCVAERAENQTSLMQVQNVIGDDQTSLMQMKQILKHSPERTKAIVEEVTRESATTAYAVIGDRFCVPTDPLAQTCKGEDFGSVKDRVLMFTKAPDWGFPEFALFVVAEFDEGDPHTFAQQHENDPDTAGDPHTFAKQLYTIGARQMRQLLFTKDRTRQIGGRQMVPAVRWPEDNSAVCHRPLDMSQVPQVMQNEVDAGCRAPVPEILQSETCASSADPEGARMMVVQVGYHKKSEDAYLGNGFWWMSADTFLGTGDGTTLTALKKDVNLN